MSPKRYTADTINDNALDRLYENANRGWRRGDAWKARAVKAEGAVRRAKALATSWAVLRTHGSAATELRAALAEADQNEGAKAGEIRCVCGDLIELRDEIDPNSWIHSPGSDTPCLDARPRTRPDVDHLLGVIASWYEDVNDGLGRDACDLIGDLERAGFRLPEGNA